MGGKSSKQITTTDIQTEVEMEIKNINQTLTNIINEQITTSTMSMVNENIQTSEQGTGGSNLFAGGDLIIGGEGNIFDVNQEVSVSATNNAVLNVVQSTDSMSKLASKINSDVMGKLNNDAGLTQSLQAASDLSTASSKAGGLADMLATVGKTMEAMTKIGQKDEVTESNKTTIKNSVKSSIQNTNITDTKIRNTVNSFIENSIKQQSAASCKISAVGNNAATFGDINVTGKNNIGKINQVLSVKALSECVIGAAQTSKMISEVTSGNDVKSTSDSGNKATAGQTMTSDIKKSETTETKDAIGDTVVGLADIVGNSITDIFSSFASLGMVGLLAPALFCLICVIFIVFMMMPKGSSSSNAEVES